MAIEQHDKEYGNRTLYRAMVLIASLMGIGVFIIPLLEKGGKLSIAGYVLITIWCVVLVIGTRWAGQVQRNYRCSKCGAHLPMLRPEASTKYQHRFHCVHCDITWTTDVSVGD
jgi:DNA-directed RNA polymerase subunit RPC12/RpoP